MAGNGGGETKNRGQDEVAKMISDFDLTGISAREFCALAGLDPKWIDNARAGKFRSAKSAVARQKFKVALDAVKSSRGLNGKGSPAAQVRPASGEGAESLGKLREAIRKADSPDECIALQKLMDDMVAPSSPGGSGELDVATHRALNDSIKERRQLLELRARQQEQARAGEPIEIRVVYVNQWRKSDDGREGGA